MYSRNMTPTTRQPVECFAGRVHDQSTCIGLDADRVRGFPSLRCADRCLRGAHAAGPTGADASLPLKYVQSWSCILVQSDQQNKSSGSSGHSKPVRRESTPSLPVFYSQFGGLGAAGTPQYRRAEGWVFKTVCFNSHGTRKYCGGGD